MTAYNPTGTVFHTAYDLPAAGAPATAASVNDQALKYLGDNSQFLYNLTLPLTAGGNFTPAAPIVFQGLSAGIQVPSGTIIGNFVQSLGGANLGPTSVHDDLTAFGTVFGKLGTVFRPVSHLDNGGSLLIDRNKYHNGITLGGTKTNWFIDPSPSEVPGDWVIVVFGESVGTITVTCSDGTLVTLSSGGNHWAFAMRVQNSAGTYEWKVLMRGTTP